MHITLLFQVNIYSQYKCFLCHVYELKINYNQSKMIDITKNTIWNITLYPFLLIIPNPGKVQYQEN